MAKQEKSNNKYKICVYAICKNEAHFVDSWMDSMCEANMIVVTDTGSTDDTVEKLRARGAIVYVEEINPWRFDVARNISLEHVPDDVDICVCTDLDERFVPGWRECLERVWMPDAHMAHYLYNWSLKPDGSPDIQFTYFKVHTKNDYVWSYPIHECLSFKGTPPERKVYAMDMILNHYPDPSKSRGSYIDLLELAREEMPNSDRIAYYLGREYMYRFESQKCIDMLKQHLAMPTATWREERCASMRWIAVSYARLGNRKEAYSWYYRAIAEAPNQRDPYVEFAKLAYDQADWPIIFYCVTEAQKIKERSTAYVNMGYCWDETLDDLGAMACYHLGMYEKALIHANTALALNPKDQRLQNNIKFIQKKADSLNQTTPASNKSEILSKLNNKLIHTMLFFLRTNHLMEDLDNATQCLHSLQKSTYKTVVIYNQGFYSNKQLEDFLQQFQLNCIVIGKGQNDGIVIGRKACSEYIWEHYPDTQYISDLHLDMIFTDNWEDALVSHLDQNDDGVISCGIIDKDGLLKFSDHKKESVPLGTDQMDDFLKGLRSNTITHGFTHPCVHNSKILKEIGGYRNDFLRGKQCFEDDSILLGYYYYYGTKANWKPKVTFESVVYHAIGGQRLTVNDNIMVNLRGLINQYGAMGMNHLRNLHKNPWSINFFNEQYQSLLK